MKPDIDNIIGKVSPPATAFVGYILSAVSLFIAFLNPLLGIPVLAIGLYLGFGKNGVEIKSNEKSLREYSSLFGLKFGSWKSIENYPDIAVLRNNVVSSAHSITNRSATTDKNTFFEIYLLDKNHRVKQLVKRMDEFEQALDEAKKLAKKLNVDLKNYNPVISQATRARRRR